MMTALYCIVLSSCFTYALAFTNYRPIIGVLAQEINSTHGDTYIQSNYFSYVQMAGARAVPIRMKMPVEYYKSMFQSINGLLFPGGGVDLLTSEYAKAAKLLFSMALKMCLNALTGLNGLNGICCRNVYTRHYEANDAGDHFPIWATCMGFELLTAIVTNRNVLTKYDAEDLALPLQFEPDFRNSRMFENLPDDVYLYLSTKNVTENFHHLGLSPQAYENANELKKFFKVLSTNEDRNGKQFVSTMEAYNYPVYGTQWHPEKTMYTWRLSYNVAHTPEAIRVSQHMANFLVAEARKSGHTFPSLQEEIDALIDNYTPVFSKDSHFTHNYYFNYTTEDPAVLVS